MTGSAKTAVLVRKQEPRVRSGTLVALGSCVRRNTAVCLNGVITNQFKLANAGGTTLVKAARPKRFKSAKGLTYPRRQHRTHRRMLDGTTSSHGAPNGEVSSNPRRRYRMQSRANAGGTTSRLKCRFDSGRVQRGESRLDASSRRIGHRLLSRQQFVARTARYDRRSNRRSR